MSENDLPTACACEVQTPENFRDQKAAEVHWLLLDLRAYRTKRDDAEDEGLDQTSRVFLDKIDKLHRRIGELEEEITQSFAAEADPETPVTEEPKPEVSPP